MALTNDGKLYGWGWNKVVPEEDCGILLGLGNAMLIYIMFYICCLDIYIYISSSNLIM